MQTQSQSQNSTAGGMSQSQSQGSVRLQGYEVGDFFDELIHPDGTARPDAVAMIAKLNDLPEGELSRRQTAIEKALYSMGITFTVYSDAAGTEKIMPFDAVPRILSAACWQPIADGLKQRIRALNRFLTDIYNDQKILDDGVVPRSLIESCPAFLKQCRGLRPPGDVWCHITGTDMVRDNAGDFYVLEDNLRNPSGVSYMLQNRVVMKRNFPQLFGSTRVRPVGDYPARLYKMLRKVACDGVDEPTVVVLTPGVYNSAYYEHSFLAHQMGVELVEGRDLVVQNERVFMKTTYGLRQVDVIYRRIDDTFMDPETFNPKSLLGVPGLMKAYRAGNVTLANAPGTGVADDKVIYAFVPEMIRYYLGEEPIAKNVPTYVCQREDDRDYVLSHLDELVIKAAGESGGYGILIGPHASDKEREEFADAIRKNPRNYVAQPTLQLSRVPTICDGNLEGRHVDLRPYVLCSGDESIHVVPGGLTRVALRRGSLVVNSSQGGGSKDTWVAAKAGESVAKV